MKTIFVTGASGFVGSHVSTLLTRSSYNVVAMTRRSTSTMPPAHLAQLPIEWVSVEQAEQAIRSHSPHAVIHLATDYARGGDLARCLETNLVLPLRLLMIANRAGCKLFLNTDTFFGKPSFGYSHMKPYILSKAHFETWGRQYASTGQLKFLTLRLEHAYGEYDSEEKFVPHLLRRLIDNQPSVALTSGIQRRDFIHAADVAQAYLLLLECFQQIGAEENQLDVGTGKSTSVMDLVKTAKEIARSDSHLDFGALPQRDGEITESHSDSKLLRSFGWSPVIGLQTGLERTIKYIQSSAS